MKRVAILGEDRSDVATLTVLVRRLAKDERLPVHGKGYDGCAQLLRKGARDLNLFFDQGHDAFVIAYDADRDDPQRRRELVVERVVRASRVAGERCCVVVPVQEIEAWILADLTVATEIWPRWRPDEIANPELVVDPKEHLERLSRRNRRRGDARLSATFSSIGSMRPSGLRSSSMQRALGAMVRVR